MQALAEPYTLKSEYCANINVHFVSAIHVHIISHHNNIIICQLDTAEWFTHMLLDDVCSEVITNLHNKTNLATKGVSCSALISEVHLPCCPTSSW